MTNNLEKRILEKIKKDEIKPRSRSYFVIKNSFSIATYVILIILGSTSFSVLFYLFSNNTSSLVEIYNIYQLKNAIFFWGLLLIAITYFSLKNISSINNNYKYNPFSILFSNLVISIILGLFLFNAGIGKKTDDFSSENLSFYQKNIHITEIKKNIFLNKVKKIGITKKILDENPNLKIQFEKKFNELVLGRELLEENSDCNLESFSCEKDQIFFKDEKGCGCLKIYK